MGRLIVSGRGAPEVVDDVAFLCFVPPTKEFYLQTVLLQPHFGLLNLHLQAAMSQGEGVGVIEEDLHGFNVSAKPTNRRKLLHGPNNRGQNVTEPLRNSRRS